MLAWTGCTASDPQAPVGQRATTAAPPPAADPCDDRECTLAEAAGRAGLRIGVHLERVDEPSVEVALREFDLLTNHGISLAVIEPERGRFDFAAPDEMTEIAGRRGLPMHGFHWLWSQTLLDLNPPWFDALTDPDEMWAVAEEHLRAVAQRYPGIERINVVNEPLQVSSGELVANQYLRALGPDYIAEAFRRADRIAPDVELFLNENLVEYNPAKADAYLALIEGLVDRGVPIDGVGLQTHLFLGEPDWQLMARVMRRISDLGLAVSITELDAPTEPDLPDRDRVQAERMAHVVRLCIETPRCDTVIIWGVHDGATWVDSFLRPGLDPLLFDRDLRPKPAYRAVRDELLAAPPGPRRARPHAKPTRPPGTPSP